VPFFLLSSGRSSTALLIDVLLDQSVVTRYTCASLFTFLFPPSGCYPLITIPLRKSKIVFVRSVPFSSDPCPRSLLASFLCSPFLSGNCVQRRLPSFPGTVLSILGVLSFPPPPEVIYFHSSRPPPPTPLRTSSGRDVFSFPPL